VGTLKRRWRHAFAVDPPGGTQPTPEQAEVVDAFCRRVARHHLTTPGLASLEMVRPLNFIGSQVMHFFSPFVWALAAERTHEGYKHLATFLERRGSIEYLARRIEHFEQEFERQERERKEQVKAKKATFEQSGSFSPNQDHERD
jgi:hypothetical protein